MNIVKATAAAVILMSFGASDLRAQEAARPQPNDSKQRWEQLSPEERKRLKDRFEHFKQLPPEQQAQLQDRHHALNRTRDEALRGLPPEEAERLRQLSPEERRRALHDRVEQLLPEMRNQILPERGTERPQRVPFHELRSAVQSYASERLQQFEQDGVLGPGEAARLLSLPPWKLPEEIRGLKKREFLQHPPRKFLELAPGERERLAALSPDAFFDEVERQIGGPPHHGPRAPLRDLVDGFQKRLRGQGGQGGRGVRGAPPRQFLEHFTPEQASQVEAAHGKDRARLIHDFLKADARAALIQRGEDPNQVEQLESASSLEPFERDLRLLRMIDPTAELPPPPQHAQGPANGGGAPDSSGQRWD